MATKLTGKWTATTEGFSLTGKGYVATVRPSPRGLDQGWQALLTTSAGEFLTSASCGWPIRT